MNMHHTKFERDMAALTPDLVRLARHIGRDAQEAEDVVQDVLLSTLRRCRARGPIEDLRPYLHAALRNRLRRPAEKAEESEVELAAPGQAEDRLMLRDVEDALSALPADQARILRAFALEGESYARIAARLDMPAGTVMSKLARARAHLRDRLDLPDGTAVAALIAPRDG
ncbi:RNA polymerase sigma factor [Cognatishimia sp. MH4019]|uniref:RNA polymerase sigma factor n=1 Tax=Cognatishimia sp. MH4019 TaxID=2854030 RepID=UPI001CD70F6B|nr:sigma-70 family RNA polymerase sigma factor [Cognatishimia sp. MH4019]